MGKEGPAGPFGVKGTTGRLLFSQRDLNLSIFFSSNSGQPGIPGNDGFPGGK